MGNRGTVVFQAGDHFSPAVYLHWNGGPESVYAFLEELDRRDVRADADYECARFVQLVGEFMDSDGQSGLSLGLVNGPRSSDLSELDAIYTDHGDNGLYLVDRQARTVRRFVEDWHNGNGFQEVPAEQVERERSNAESSEYRPALASYFETLRSRRALTV